MAKKIIKKLTEDIALQLLTTLKTRFEKNKNRHKNIDWNNVLDKLKKSPQKLWTLHEMEISGGEPDVVSYDKATGEYSFFDCSAETPKDRRSLCYDKEGLDARKEFKPSNTAMDMAEEMGMKMLDEAQYLMLQKLGKFDTKTSSWINTPAEMRKLGGALFADYRFGRVFFYHNTAQSYYGSRGFRGELRV